MRAAANISSVRSGAARLAAAFAAAVVLLAAQILVLAHANSKEAHAPHHSAQSCVLHANGDRPASAVAPDAVVVAAPAFALSLRI
ncbi:MAG: hypothetical protein K2Q06_11800, partial [Parvularculaceae bacterium]|nr:hypothetical protein [Parvularculaceae bacterium]